MSDPLEAISRETRAKLEIYETELRRWQTVTNLVGPSTLPDLRTRHFADSLQLSDLAEGEVWVDLGSGAGFPGMVVAIARPDRLVHLIESDGRKCAFLRHVARATGAAVRVWEGRIEAFCGAIDPCPTVVTARALAPLSRLIGFSREWLSKGAVGLFPKGRDHAAELTEAAKAWRFAADIVPSRIADESRILRVRDFAGPQPQQPAAT